MTLPAHSLIVGSRVRLRLVNLEDVHYIHSLRSNPQYNKYLSPIEGSVEVQRKWIMKYKLLEANCAQLYYVIERLDGVKCGLVRLYGIDNDTFTWGSWILDENKPSKAALESAILSLGVGFCLLNLGCAKVDVRIKNTHAEAFYRRLGMIEVSRTQEDIFFVYPRAAFDKAKADYMKLLEGNSL